MRFSIQLLFLSTLLLGGCSSGNKENEKKPIQVSYIIPVQDSVFLFEEFVGQTYGKSDIQIIPRVEGNILQIHFKEGAKVQQGDLLYTIDPLTYQSKVQEALGSLESARSELVRAEAELRRIRPLADLNAVSKRDLDDAIAKVNVAKAQVKSAEAMVNQQNIKLSYCQVTAPLTGIIGISKLKVGDYVSPLNRDNVLNTISDVTEIRVRFSITENKFLELSKKAEEAKGLQNADVALILGDQSTYNYTGKLSIRDRSLDPATGTLTVEAVFPNPEKRLIPGQFVRIRIPSEVVPNAITVPERAVIELQGIYQVYVINDQNKLEVRNVQVTPPKNGKYIITSGLKGNEKVAVVGSMFIKPDMVIAPVKVVTDSIL